MPPPRPPPPPPPPVSPQAAEPGAFGQAFRDPEAFILRWHRDGSPYSGMLFVGLTLTAVLGTLAYGTLLGVAGGPLRMLECAGLYCLAAGLAWAAPLPAVYILNSLMGMRLRASTTFLASLVAAAWGGFALLAFLPITLIYLATFPNRPGLILVAHLIVFSLVGVSMACIFGRQIQRLEPRQGGSRIWWLWLFVCLKVQLLYSLGLIRFDF